MSNVASLENCKRLHGLSGWQSDLAFYANRVDKAGLVSNAQDTYAYSAGYLLRKLPVHISVHTHANWESDNKDLRRYHATDHSAEVTVKADTPEDALCLLAIKLFEEGVIK